MSENEDDKGAGEELKEGLKHFFSAARKLAKNAEPKVNRSLDEAERVLSKIGRGGEVVASEVGREMASLASRLADRLRNATERDERRSTPAPAPEGEHEMHASDAPREPQGTDPSEGGGT